jgi:hypothetical protein
MHCTHDVELGDEVKERVKEKESRSERGREEATNKEELGNEVEKRVKEHESAQKRVKGNERKHRLRKSKRKSKR